MRAAIAIATLLVASPTEAAVINLVTDGSFEQLSYTANGKYLTLGSSSVPGWTVTTTTAGSGPGLGPEAFITNGTYANAYGDKVVADNATTPYPNADKSGTYGIYFVDDNAYETLTQSIYLTPGTYEVGFDVLATGSGYGNPGNPSFTVGIAGYTIVSANISSLSKAVWTHFAANVTVNYAGLYNYSLVYNALGSGTAKDIVVDNFYVFTPSTIPGQGTVISEPASLALLGAALAATAALRRRIA